MRVTVGKHITTWDIIQCRTTHHITHHTKPHTVPYYPITHTHTNYNVTSYIGQYVILDHHITSHHITQHATAHYITPHHITQHATAHHSTHHTAHITPHHITQQSTQHNVLVSQLPGMNPAPMPWILCGPGLPPEITGDSAGSTAMTFTVSLTDFKNYTVQYYTVWVSIVLVALE